MNNMKFANLLILRLKTVLSAGRDVRTPQRNISLAVQP